VAFSCSAVGDDPVQFDALTIPDPTSQLQKVTLLDSQEVIHNFNL
jgi:hypothetical protein